MPAISPGLKIIISVFASLAGIIFAVFSAFLAPDFKYWISKYWTKKTKNKYDKKPKKKSWIVWGGYVISGLVMIIGPAVVAVAPSIIPPHYFVVIDSSSRMNVVFPDNTSGFPAGTSKWAALQGSIQGLLDFSLDSNNYRLIVLGGNHPISTRSCNQIENKYILDDREKIIDTIRLLEPGGVASLNNALRKVSDVLPNIPEGQKTFLYIFLGGGDECAKNDGKDEWEGFKNFLRGTASVIDRVEIEIILLSNEDETIIGADEITKTITKYNLTNVNVHTPENSVELEQLINQFTNNLTPTPISQPPSTPIVTQRPATTPPTFTPVTPSLTFTPTPPSLTFTPIPPSLTFTPVTPSQTSTVAPTHTASPPPECDAINWEFSTNNDSQEWQAGQGITLVVQDGYMTGVITQSQSFWTGPINLNIDATTYKTLQIRYRVDSPGVLDAAYFYWITADDNQFGNDKRARFDIQTDNTWQEATIDLTPIVNWNGTITSIQLYPAWISNSGAFVQYDYIRVCQ